MEPKRIVYIDQGGDCWFVWLNTSDDSHLENSFNSYEEALVFAQSWADGITAKDEVECEVILNEVIAQESSKPNIDMAVAAESAEDFVKALTPLFEALKALNKTMPMFLDNTIAFKRLYLGTTYSYNLLSRCRFLVKSPRVVHRVASIIIWIFVHLPKKLVLRWPPPKLCD